MAWNEFDLVTERKQFFADGVNQRGMVAARKVGTSNRAGKKHIANSGEPRLPMKEHDVARRMAGAVNHFERLLAEGNGIAVFQPAIRHEGFNRWKAVGTCLLRQILQKEEILLMWPLDTDAKSLRQNTGRRRVIEMTMRQQYLFDLGARVIGNGEDALKVATRVDYDCPPRLFTDQQRAILFKRRYGNDGVFHPRQYTRGGFAV